ncbi:MAG: hypothetical protein PHQ60_16425 [Sideroxydans sp.]|nr:hypothetical protein [Sideroxydans sp.]
MADITRRIAGLFDKRWKDMGDDTHAEVVYVGGQAAGVGGATTIADGADATQGKIADAAVVTNAAGTVSGKLRGVVKLLGDVVAALAGILTVKIDQTTPGTTNKVVISGTATVDGAVVVSGTATVDGDVDANLQVGDADVGALNPVPVSDAGDSLTVDGVVTAHDTPRGFSSGLTHTPAADTAAVVTLPAAGEGLSHVIRGVAWGYSEAPTGGSLTIEDGAGTTVFHVPITAAGPGFIPVFGKGSANTALVITLAAGGGTCEGSVNILEHWTE